MTDPQQVLEALHSARAQVEVPEEWWNGSLGETGIGGGSNCALTAFADICGDAYALATDVLAEAMGGVFEEIPEFNDSHTHAEVLAAFDKAIATVEAEIEPTPNADACLSVMGACDVAGAVLASFICLEHPHMDEDEVSALASAELFYAAQDTARACSLGVQIERA